MTAFTRPATWDDLKLLAIYLNEAGAAYALIGGYAIAAHGYNRFSEDIDVLVDPAPDNTRRWVAALSRLPDGAAHILAGDDNVLAEGDGPPAIRINDEFTVDVMAAACGYSWHQLASDIITVMIDEVPVRVLGLAGLLRTKEGMRTKDRADAEVLRAALAARQDEK